MKALTIRQPWAWAIARGHKPVENRSWTTPYRGPLAIHAGLRWDDATLGALGVVVHRIRQQGGAVPPSLRADLPYSGTGRIVAVAELVDVCTRSMDGEPCDCGLWAVPGEAHWQIRDARPIDGPEVRGRLGLWDWDSEGGEPDGE